MTGKLVVGLAGVLCVVFVTFAQYVDRALVCCYVLGVRGGLGCCLYRSGRILVNS